MALFSMIDPLLMGNRPTRRLTCAGLFPRQVEPLVMRFQAEIDLNLLKVEGFSSFFKLLTIHGASVLGPIKPSTLTNGIHCLKSSFAT